MKHTEANPTSVQSNEQQVEPDAPAEAQDSWRFRRRRPRHMSTEYFDPAGVQEFSIALRRVLDDTSVPEAVSPSRAETVDSDVMMRDLFSPREILEIDLQDLGLTFDGLGVVGTGTTMSVQPTVASVLNPVNCLSFLQSLLHPKLRDIITGFEGSVRPGEILLVLGRPGAGTSTLLRVLANQRRGYHKIEGNVYYDWISPSEIDKLYRGDVQYYPAQDLLLHSLSVEQTILFAAKTRVAQGPIVDFHRNDYAGLMTEACITVMGLKSLKKTPIEKLTMQEKKRVSICEMLVTRSRIACWDSTVTEFDESGALEFVQALRLATDLAHTTTLIALYQCSEAIYDLVDKVCLIYEGKMIYYGSSDRARQYFIDMGYQPRQRQTTIEFLLSLTDARNRRHLVQTSSIPKKPSEFASYYDQSQLREQNRRAMRSHEQEPISRRSEPPLHPPHARRKNPYIRSYLEQLWLVISLRFHAVKYEIFHHLLVIFWATCEAIMLGATFSSLNDITLHYFSRGGVFFLSLMIPAIFNLSEITFYISQRSTILSHRQMAMYHTSIAALEMSILDIPYNLIKMVPYTLVIYYMTGLASNARQYMTYFLFNVVHSLCIRSYARAVAALLGNNTIAQGIGGVVFLMCSLYAGFELPQRAMHRGLKWIMYINPIRYAFEGMMGNEFKHLNGLCPQPAPSGPGYEGISAEHQVCTLIGGWPGDLYVEGADYVREYFGFEVSQVWMDLGLLCAIYGIWTIAFLVISEYSVSKPGKGPVVFIKHVPRAPLKKAIIQNAEGRDEEKDEANERDMFEEFSGLRNSEDEVAMMKLDKMHDSFCWHNVGYTIQLPGSELRVLDFATGYILPGQMVAVLGEPGSGKRTLVKVLAERAEEGWISGDRYLDWRRLPPDYHVQVGYCHNTDIHVPTGTVYSAFKYSALMRQPPNVKYDEMLSYARLCIRACGLDAVKDAMVGSLKPEQRRRVSIGLELASRPRLLFLDSPTTGLDPQSALAIMVFLRDLANHGQTILCSIHEPSAEIFELFDQVLVLQKLGKVAYFGDIGPHTSTVVEYFQTRSSRVLKSSDNPAEFIVDVLSNTILDKDWHRIWMESDEFKIMRNKIHTTICQEFTRQPVPARRTTHFVHSWPFQTWVLFRRQMIHFWRSPGYILPKLFLNVVGGLFIGFSFFDADNSILGARNKLFSIFSGVFLCVPLGFIMMFPYFKLRGVYEGRERANASYSRSALTAAQLFAEVPWNVFGSTLFFVTWYWTVGFPTNRAVLCYLIYGVLFPMYYTSLALCLGSMSPTASVASFLYSSIISFILTFDDTVQPFSEMGWFRWLYYITPYTYITDSIYGYTLGHTNVECSADELSVIEPPSGLTCIAYLAEYIGRAGGYILNPNNTNSCVFCPVGRFDEWMMECYNISFSHRWRDLLDGSMVSG